MSNFQLFFAAGFPTISVVLGILMGQRALEKLEKRMDGMEQRTERRFDRVESRLDRIEAHLREFYRTIGLHEARLDTLEKRSA